MQDSPSGSRPLRLKLSVLEDVCKPVMKRKMYIQGCLVLANVASSLQQGINRMNSSSWLGMFSGQGTSTDSPIPYLDAVSPSFTH